MKSQNLNSFDDHRKSITSMNSNDNSIDHKTMFKLSRSSLGTFHSHHSTFLIISLILFQFTIEHCTAVKIVRHWIQQTVDSSNQSTAIILDCDYVYDDLDTKLVVRWFFNDSPEPIYQWIPESNSRYVGKSIQHYFDMNFQIGDDRFTKYRAIRLMPRTQNHYSNDNRILSFPITELTGNYSCVISSIMSQDSRKGQVVFYVPPSKFEFNIFSSDGNLNFQSDYNVANGPMVRCNADNVYPKPSLTFSELVSVSNGFQAPNADYQPYYYHSSSPSSSPTSWYHMFPQIDVKMTTINQTELQLYKIWFEYRLKVDSLKVGTIYECRLEIPMANYIRKKRIKLIYPSTYMVRLPATKTSQPSSSSSSSSNGNDVSSSNDNSFRWYHPNHNHHHHHQSDQFQQQQAQNINQNSMNNVGGPWFSQNNSSNNKKNLSQVLIFMLVFWSTILMMTMTINNDC